MRTALNRNKALSREKTFNAPVKGWFLSANRGAIVPDSATVLDNWVCEVDGIRARAGTTGFGKIAGVVQSLFTYENGTNQKLFATDETAIYDASAPADENTNLAPLVAGQTSGRYSTATMTNAGGVFLVAVNGSNAAQIYDGNNWATTPAITGVNSADLSNVWSYRNRLLFIQKDSLNAWFLGTESVGGAAQQIALAGVFEKAGSLVFGATWSLDAGDGVDDLCVFVTDRGEVAVYQGDNPADVNNWSLSGVYDIGPPLGPEAFYSVGGDLLIATEEGIIPISSAIQKERTTLSLTALSFPIEPAWRAAVNKRRTLWNLTKWPSKNYAVVSFADDLTLVNEQFVVNLETGAWSRFTGWEMQSIAIFKGNMYYGNSQGRIMQAESGGSDDDEPYFATMIGDYDHLGAPAREKVAKMAQGVFISSLKFNPRLSVTTDFKNQAGMPPDVAQSASSSFWDVGLWDGAAWDGLEARQITSKWVSAYRVGQYLAPKVEIAFSSPIEPFVQLIAFNLLYEMGATSQ